MNNIKYYRKKKGITQNKLAVMLGITQGTVAGWEGGFYMPNTSNLIKLAAILDVTIDDLLKKRKLEKDPA